jgi:hypothetical protein
MSYDEYAWRSFLTEARKPTPKPKYTLYERKLLRELDDEEVEHVRDAIDNMGAEELAFNDLFEGKTRLVLDFPTMDTSSDLGKFVDMFRVMGYDVNWEKGLISGERELKDGSISASVANLMGTEVPPPKKRKVQMKIGKFWAKIYELASKREALSQKVFDHLDSLGYTLGGFGRISEPGMLTGKMIAAALDEEEQKRYQQLYDQLVMYLEDGALKLDSSADAKKYQEYWQQNADYIKKNIGDLTEDKYVIIVTRDPIDILRMSDFNRITSCHSPPSRGGGDSYYKCAVAEAHGHGAIAYAVEKEELIGATESETIEQAEAAIQEGEIFADDVRGSHVGLSTKLLPVARLRLRQVRANTYGDSPPAGFSADSSLEVIRVTEVAVPETRVYGLKIPGFRDRVFNWAKEAQAAMIESIPEDATWIKYGGSYEDNNIKGLLHDLTGRELERVGQNTETEDMIDDDVLLGGLVRRTEEECEEFADYWNNMYQACEVGFEVVDDGGGGIYIDISAHMRIQWDADEWESMPNDVSDAISELNDMGWGWASANDYTTRLRRDGDNIVLKFSIDPEGLPDFGAQGYAYNAENFEEFCVEVNTVDDMLDGVKGELERIFKREGYMEGGALDEWGMEIVNGDYDSYEWDAVAGEGYEHDEIENIEVSHTAYPAIPDGMSAQDARMILESRDFTIPLRKALVEKAWADTGMLPDDRHYPNFRVHTEELRTQDETNIKLVLTFEADANSSDAQVKSMRLTVDEWDDEEVLDAAIQEVFNQVVGEGLTGRGDMDTPTKDSGERDEESEKSASPRFPRLMPSQKVTNESIVKNWKNFLYN